MFLQSLVESASKTILALCFYQRRFFNYLYIVTVLFRFSLFSSEREQFSLENHFFYTAVQMTRQLHVARISRVGMSFSSLLCSLYFLLDPTYHRFVYFNDLFKEKTFIFIDYLLLLPQYLSTSTLALTPHFFPLRFSSSVS